MKIKLQLATCYTSLMILLSNQRIFRLIRFLNRCLLSALLDFAEFATQDHGCLPATVLWAFPHDFEMHADGIFESATMNSMPTGLRWKKIYLLTVLPPTVL